ncbi:hypothetical protein IQ254_16045 [Nodosilinea sp. LEGE 07088]|uniref:hypothetical protein n=1 Tax=Nodosilinea sp. LEGE 07088 TaxID=2777968 RepID=UPI001881350E|nr:hypothetical protein [Nodosilinea sp. LEGE 07088]MBE9138686.1 hypothetical protein [Nodosilinea sp. LEGE 07088]
MTWLALVLIAIAFFLWRYGRRHPDEVARLLGFSLALVCVLAGLVAAPGLLKIAILTALIVYPDCTPRVGPEGPVSDHRIIKPSCPKYCLLRRQCRNPP